MKPDNRHKPQESGQAPANAPVHEVDPDQPFPGNPSPDDPEDVGNLDAAYEGKEHGEGNYQASKDYGKRVRSFVRSGQVEQAAEQAKPRDGNEARELTQAEEQGRRRSKGEDPSAGKNKSRSSAR